VTAVGGNGQRLDDRLLQPPRVERLAKIVACASASVADARKITGRSASMARISS